MKMLIAIEAPYCFRNYDKDNCNCEKCNLAAHCAVDADYASDTCENFGVSEPLFQEGQCDSCPRARQCKANVLVNAFEKADKTRPIPIKPGKYLAADPCYVLSEEDYDLMSSNIPWVRCGVRKFAIPNDNGLDTMVYLARTSIGDGIYPGFIGISDEDVAAIYDSKHLKQEDSQLIADGTIFDNCMEFAVDSGMLALISADYPKRKQDHDSLTYKWIHEVEVLSDGSLAVGLREDGVVQFGNLKILT
jgi:hypothetical protein